MAGVVFDHLTKRFGDVVAVNDLNIEIPDQEFLVLVGPSGCGKSTALRLLAGLEEISDGNIYIGDRLVNNLAPKDRDIAMVFQSYALYPHMTVYDNMAFGLSLRRLPKEEIRRRVLEAGRILGMEELLNRKPGQLSGGQRQRVALGRAIVREPAVFLLDEPLSNLDAKLRVQTRAEITKLHQRLGTTFIYVTHDQVEAMTMASQIAVLDAGVLQQMGKPQELYTSPVNIFVAGFIGSPAMNFFDVTLIDDEGEMFVDRDGFRCKVPTETAEKLRPNLGKKIVMGIRPEDIHDRQFPPPGITPAEVTAQVDVTELMGNEVFVYLLMDKKQLLARVDPRTEARTGQQMDVVFNMANMHAFDPETQQALY
ncbi:MAG: sn-glycerol-3-phosphate ABC transporter ATP-binding protein UgpC [Dehalococcoidia bacterium]